MIPNVCSDHELAYIIQIILEAAAEVFSEKLFKSSFDYICVGVMLES
jgi:hypothetical protein